MAPKSIITSYKISFMKTGYIITRTVHHVKEIPIPEVQYLYNEITYADTHHTQKHAEKRVYNADAIKDDPRIMGLNLSAVWRLAKDCPAWRVSCQVAVLTDICG